MFHVSTKSRYGLRALVELAVRAEGKPVSLNELARGQEISKKYLENIFRMLQQNGIVRSVRGAKGGYLVAAEPEGLSLLNILDAIDGPVRLLECIDAPKICRKTKDCFTRRMWQGLETHIKTYLQGRTLRDLVDDFRAGGRGFKGMHI